MTATAAPRPGDVSTGKSLAFVYVGYAFRYLYLLVLVPFYGRVLGAAEYGRVLAAMSLYQIVWLLSEYGYPSLGIRDVALERSPGNSARVYAVHLSGRLLTTAVGVAVGSAGTFASPLLRERPIFGVLATLAGIVSAYNLGWFFQGMLRFRTSVLVEILGFSLNLLAVLALVRGRSDGWLVLASLFGSTLAATAVAHGIALRSMDRTSLRWDGGVELLRQSTALFLARALAVVTSSSSTLLLSLFASATQVGWFGAADRLATAGLSLMLPANQVMTGTIAGLIGSERTVDAAFALIRRGLVALTALGGAMLLGALALARWAVPLILGPDFGPSARMLQILAVGFPFAAFAQVVNGYVLVPLRFDRAVSAVSFVGALVTVVLTVTLGRTFQGDGVAWARALGYMSMCAMLVHVVWRERLGAALLPQARTEG
jgi:PST family polysaccharide transporter